MQRPPIIPGGQQPFPPPQRPPPNLNPNIQGGIRPGTPFPRQPGPRSPGIYPQKSFPVAGSPRPPVAEDLVYRSQTLDSTDYIGSKPEDVLMPMEESKPSLAAMKNRSYSLSSNEPTVSLPDERRRSVSSIGSVEERSSSGLDNRNGRIDDLHERPESRASLMNKIAEDDDDESPNKSPMSNDNSIDNLSQKSNFSPSPQPSSLVETQIEQKPAVDDAMHSSLYVKDEEKNRPTSRNSEGKSPVPIKTPEKPTHLDISSDDAQRGSRKTPDSARLTPDVDKRERKTPDTSRKTPDIYKSSRKTPESGLRKTPDSGNKKHLDVDKNKTRKTTSNGKMVKSPTKSGYCLFLKELVTILIV